MTPSDSSRRAAPRRRQAVALPKRRNHLSYVLIFLILLIGLPLIWVEFFASEDAAIPKGSVIVETVEEGDQISGLDLDGESLPDLLADTVPVGTNPTAASERPVSRPVPEPERQTLVAPRANPLAPLDPSMKRESPFGPLPGPNTSGRTPLQAYRAPAPSLSGQNAVAVIVGGLGVNSALTRKAIDDLPPSVTLSFAAHAPNLQSWINRARSAGHEVLLEIPMEGTNFNPSEPGAVRAMRSVVSASDNRRNLQSTLARAEGYVGIINYNGQNILTRSDLTSPILQELGKSGIAFFFDGAFDAPSLPALSQSLGLPFASGKGLIDPVPDPAQITSSLNRLTMSARAERRVFGVGFAYPETIDAITQWATTLPEEDVTLVPASAILE